MKTGNVEIGMRKIFFIVFALCAVMVVSCNDDDDPDGNSLSSADQNFITKAAQGNRAEIVLGNLADSMGTDDSVRMYGQMMMNDHTTAWNDLQSITTEKSITLSQDIDSEHQQMQNVLMNLSGAEFDSAYIQNQIVDHQNNITLFQNERDYGQYKKLKDYAIKYLPKLQSHLDRAKVIADSLANASTGTD